MNRLLILALVNKTPYEAWDGKRPSLSQLRVFGCDASMHIPKERIWNLESKLGKCTFIDYKDGVKGYKLWNPAIKTIVYSQDLIFREVGSTSET